MKQSKFFLVILAGVLALATLAGCGGSAAGGGAAPSEAPSSQSSSEAQPAAEKIKVGIVQPMDHPSLNTIRESILAEFEAQGLADKIEVDCQNAQGDNSNVAAILNKFIGDEYDVIVPIATGPAQAAAAATKDIPVVFAAVSYPVEAGLVGSMDKTDGNVTGVTNAIAIEDIFELAKALTPGAKTFGFIYNTGEVNAVSSVDRAKEYCDQNGLSYTEAIITSTNELSQAARSLSGKVDAIFTPNDNMVASAMPTLAQEAVAMKLPVYVGADSMVADGGFASVGIDYTILGAQVAQMVERIALEGQSVDENPIEVVNEYARLINETTAKAIGVPIPDELRESFTILGQEAQQ